MKNKIPYRFFAVTFLWSWLFMIPLAIFANLGIVETGAFHTSAITLPVLILAAFGPAVGAFYSLRTIEGHGAIKKFLKSFLSVKFGWKVWTAIFAVLGAASFIAWIVPELWGEARLNMFLPSAYVFPVYILMMIFLGGGQEEIGWRGYIMPYLENRFGYIYSSIILGIVWAVWHLPLWFIPGTSQTYMPFFAFMLATIGYSFFFSWIIHASGNRLFSGLVAHGVANAFTALFPTLIMEENVSQIRWWIYCILILVAGVVVVGVRVYKNKKINVRM